MSSLFHLMFGLTIMEDALDTACSENKGIILLGDFNKDLLPDSNHPHVKSWTVCQMLYQQAPWFIIYMSIQM